MDQTATLSDYPEPGEENCETCDTTGKVRQEPQHGGVPAQESECPDCHGGPC